MEMHTDHAASLGIVSLNTLYDETRTNSGLILPQHKRIESLAHTITSLPLSPDVLMLQEVHVTPQHHNGEKLAELLGFEQQYWYQHNRQQEHLGVCGNNIDAVYDFEIGDNRKAVVALLGNVALINIHLRSGPKKEYLRVPQMQRIVEEADQLGFEKTIVTGDSNSLSRSPSRNVLRDAGFVSAYRTQNILPFVPGMLPSTYPTPNYRNIMLTPRQRLMFPRGFVLDVIELRGFDKNDVLQAGTRATAASDHRTLFAELKV